MPGEAPDAVVYTQPVAIGGDDAAVAAALASESAQAWHFPSALHNLCMFALTAHNPMGDAVDRVSNERAATMLRVRLPAALERAGVVPAFVVDSFGFSDSWREDGHLVAVQCAQADAARSTLVALAIEFQQGAIYEYQPVASSARLFRRLTVPAALDAAVAASVLVARVARPQFACAAPDWRAVDL